jgi:hypothetical protein
MPGFAKAGNFRPADGAPAEGVQYLAHSSAVVCNKLIVTAQAVNYPQQKVTGVPGLIRHPGVLKAGGQ